MLSPGWSCLQIWRVNKPRWKKGFRVYFFSSFFFFFLDTLLRMGFCCHRERKLEPMQEGGVRNALSIADSQDGIEDWEEQDSPEAALEKRWRGYSPDVQIQLD